MIEELQQTIGAPCEVRTMDNDLLAVGKIKSVGDSVLDVVSQDGDRMPAIFYNTPIKLNIFSGKAGKLALGGNVYITNEDFWRISNIMVFERFEKRGFFRVRTDAFAHILTDPDSLPEPGKPDMRLSFDVQLFDVSLGGAGFWCPRSIAQEKELIVSNLRLQTKEEPFTFRASVRRCGSECGKGYPIGVNIEEMDQRELDRMCRLIFVLQREEIRKRRNRIV